MWLAVSSVPAKPSQRKLPPGQRHPGRAEHHTQHADDAQGEHAAAVAEEDQPLHGVGHRRNEAERFHAPRIGGQEAWLQVTGCSGRKPRRPDTHHTATITAPMPTPASSTSPPRPSGRESTQAISSRPRPPPTHSASVWRDAPVACASSDGRSCPAGSVSGRGVQRRHARHCDHAAHRGIGRHRQHEQHHQRLEVAATDAHQRLAAATRGQHHAETEEQATDGVRQPQQARPGIDAVRRLDPAQRDHAVEADHRHADGQHPHAHARPVAEIDDVGHRAHGAEVSALRNGAKGDGQRERGPQHGGRQAGQVGFLHAGKRAGAARSLQRGQAFLAGDAPLRTWGRP